MATLILNGIAGPPKFGGAGPRNDQDWQELYRWLVQARSALLQSTLEGTAAELAATSAAGFLPGTPFFVIDRHVTYLQVKGAWVYQSGEMSGLQNGLILLALSATDAGFIYNVTDFGHQLRWNGLNWEWGDDSGDAGKGPVLFEVDPSGNGWRLYDGTQNVPYLKSDGTLGFVDLPDLVSDPTKAAFLEAGSPNAGVTAPVAPTATGADGALSTDPTGITLPANTGGPSATVAVQSGAGTTVATSTHTHTEGAVTDPGHTHTFTAVQPTISATGKPQRLTRRPFFRQ